MDECTHFLPSRNKRPLCLRRPKLRPFKFLNNCPIRYPLKKMAKTVRNIYRFCELGTEIVSAFMKSNSNVSDNQNHGIKSINWTCNNNRLVCGNEERYAQIIYSALSVWFTKTSYLLFSCLVHSYELLN